MRQWTIDANAVAARPGRALAGLIGQLGEEHFESALLEHLHPLVPAASFAIYRTGSSCSPRLFMSGSRGIRDTTRDCWQAYLSGPHLSDRTLMHDSAGDHTVLSHITAAELPGEHRARVYEAHGVLERVSVVQQAEGRLFAANFYRHQHQRPFSQSQLGNFESLAPALLALVQKHIALVGPPGDEPSGALTQWRQQLHRLDADLTPRELDVCARLLLGMTQEGIACDLGLGVPTVKTYRNRAFGRLGIHFRNQLFALAHKPARAGL